MTLIELMREEAKRLKELNDFMSSNLFPIMCTETKDLYYEETRALSKLLQMQGKMLEKMHQVQFSHEDLEVYPVVIFMSRYNGTYSGGKFIAINKDIDDDHPEEMVGSDVECNRFWTNFDEPYGKGNTPKEAYLDLVYQIKAQEMCGKKENK